jgi:hypothetical protein
MFENQDLSSHLKESSVIESASLIVAEWNLNDPENIYALGNYRYRPGEKFSSNQSIYADLVNAFDPNDEGNYYTGATDADIVIDGGFDDEGIPTTFISNKKREELLFSLEDCLGKFRPRSGINKARFFESGKYLHHSNQFLAQRPRYYIASKQDKFKYWSSYRTENSVERGIADDLNDGKYYIDDAAPFVVYKNKVPANRITVKMQTNVGTVDLGPFTNSLGTFSDPFFGEENKTSPVKWKIQYLENNNWVTAASFDENSVRQNGLPIVQEDGHVELSYGLIIPERYQDLFFYAGELSSSSLLPEYAIPGQTYLVKASDRDRGSYYIYYQGKFEDFPANYGWSPNDDSIASTSSFASELVAPTAYANPISGKDEYREFQYIEGIRVVAEAMNKFNSTLDIIEISPRLVADISDRVVSASVVKPASDLGVSGMPVGQLLASTGDMTLFDYDNAFLASNTQSLIAPYVVKDTKIQIFEVIKNVKGFNYYVPVKTMYTDGFPEINNTNRQATLVLRDLYFYFENQTAPQILLTNVSLSFAVSTLLDNIGFSNYVFRRLDKEDDPIIPYFFIEPDVTIAQVLESLALSTQSAMFFDEYNNFVVMTKDYMFPSTEERATNIVLRGSQDQVVEGAYKNKQTSTELANIIDISSQENKVFNGGSIQYESKYIQRSYGSIRQASVIDRDKTWIYKPVLLWEVAPTETTKSINDQSNTQSSYVLSAVPLNSDLSDQEPYAQNNVIRNNTIDFGEGVYWISRYNGYFYANGEIIKYDAVQYSIPGLPTSESADGTVWISSVQEYQNYFSKLPFNGKIYPTGLVRIYTEPEYEVVDGVTRIVDGPVKKHGRAQFGTPIVHHNAGLNEYWYDNDYVRGCKMDSSLLFGQNNIGVLSSDALALNPTAGVAGKADSVGRNTFRNGIIKNFLSTSYDKESDVNRLYSTQTGTTQSSAFIMTGGYFASTQEPLDHVSYVYKKLDDSYRHFGTRMRVVGRIENNEENIQSPYGSSSYYSNIGGAGGGISVLLNPETNNGYYFEIAALTENDPAGDSDTGGTFNIMFYKVMKNGDSETTSSDPAVPVLLWGGLSQILVDDGNFTGQYRMTGEDNPTVYDLSVEYENVGTSRRFYLYINNRLIQVVDDTDPLPAYNNMALFIRGGSKCMFENVYAIAGNYANNTSLLLGKITESQDAFSDQSEISISEAFRQYSMSGIVQSTYLSGLSPETTPQYNMYFEEFGTIMREAAYFDIRYDKAYPALYSQISPTFNRVKGYTVSGFLPGAYGAEFLIFNSTDTALSLDETSGNYLRIQGVTFTQQANHELTVDEYFNKKSSFSDPEIQNGQLVSSPISANQEFLDIKRSRIKHGVNEFSLSSTYLQSHDAAEELMGWMIDKIMKPRASIGVRIFPDPTIQLGDIVEIDYNDTTGNAQTLSQEKRFIVYHIEYSRSIDGPEMTLFLSEVS